MILFVEDEESLRRLIRLSLEAAGYMVVGARNGEEAIERVGTRPCPLTGCGGRGQHRVEHLSFRLTVDRLSGAGCVVAARERDRQPSHQERHGCDRHPPGSSADPRPLAVLHRTIVAQMPRLSRAHVIWCTGAVTSIESLMTEARDIATAAGALTLDWYRRADLAVDAKSDGTEVTEADRAAEQLVRDRIAAAFPDDAVMGEEQGGSVDGSRRTWIVDPMAMSAWPPMPPGRGWIHGPAPSR